MAEQQTGYRWIILIILFLSQVILSIAAYAWGPLGPFLKKSLLLNHVQIGSLTSILYLSSVISGIPAGVSVDRWGVKLNLFICLMLTGLAMTAAGFINQYALLVMVSVVAGASYGMINPIASKGLTLWFDKTFRATAFGIRQMGVTAGGAVAGVLLIYLAQAQSWHTAVFTIGLTAISMGVMGLLFYRDMPKGADSKIKKGAEQKTGLLELMKNRNLMSASVMMAFLGLGQSSISAFWVLFLKEHLNFTPMLAGTFLAVTMVSGGVGRVVWGIISDRLFEGRRLPVMKIVCVMAIAGTLTTCFWSPALPVYLAFFVAAILGFSFLGYQGVAVVIMVEACDPESAGRATGIGVTIAWVGMVLGPLLFGAIIRFGYPAAWFSIALASVVAMVLCYRIKESKYEAHL